MRRLGGASLAAFGGATLLLLATAIRSYFIADSYTWPSPIAAGDKREGIALIRGEVLYYVATADEKMDFAFWGDGLRSVRPAPPMRGYWPSPGRASVQHFSLAGIRYGAWHSSRRMLCRFFAAPIWLAAAITFAPLCWLWRRALRRGLSRRLIAAARCPSCGYDLRATPDRCPECGAVPVGATK